MENNQDVLAILKLYELRTEDEMRKARQWYSSEFSPKSAMDIVSFYKQGERASANYRMVISYWDMAASFVLNNQIDEKTFLDANTEHIFIFAKIQPFLDEVREVIQEPDYLLNLEKLCKRMPDYEEKLALRKNLSQIWKK